MTILFIANFLVVKSNKICAGNVCIPDNYDKFEMPDKHVHVDIGIEVVEILEVNDHDFSTAMYLYFDFSWTDPRLINNATSGKTLQIETSFMDNLWVPDIYIYNLKSFYNSRVLTDFGGLIILEFHKKITWNKNQNEFTSSIKGFL